MSAVAGRFPSLCGGPVLDNLWVILQFVGNLPMEQPPVPRLREPIRTTELSRVTLDELVPDDHEARIIWDYVSALDISPFLVGIRAVVLTPERRGC